MKRYHVDGEIPTLEVALSEYMNSDDLKKLAALTRENLPTRKADLAAVIIRHTSKGSDYVRSGTASMSCSGQPWPRWSVLSMGESRPAKNHSTRPSDDAAPQAAEL